MRLACAFSLHRWHLLTDPDTAGKIGPLILQRYNQYCVPF